MTKKAFSVLVIIFITQLVLSCGPCDCPTPQTFEVSYHEVEVTAWDTSGFQVMVAEDTIYKNSFGLSVLVHFTHEQIARYGLAKGTFGFSSVMATSPCDCIDDEYIYLDPIDYAEIMVINIETSEVTDVTGFFATYGYRDGGQTLEELFNKRAEGLDSFQVDLVEFDSIPKNAIFVVNIFLKSGTKLTKKTSVVNFFE